MLLRENHPNEVVRQVLSELNSHQYRSSSQRRSAQYGTTALNGLLPLLFACQFEHASRTLLESEKVVTGLRSYRHEEWLPELVQHDPKSWLWALEQGWGNVLRASSSHMSEMSIARMHRSLEPVLMAELYNRKPSGEMSMRNLDTKPCGWDQWIRAASKRNSQRCVYLMEPTRNDLEHWARGMETGKAVHTASAAFWSILSTREPALANHVRHMEQATNMLDGKWNDYTALQALAHAIRHGHADISNNAVVPDGVMNG